MNFYRMICHCGSRAGSQFDHSHCLCTRTELEAPHSQSSRRGCFTALAQQLSKAEQHKYLCVKKKINHAFCWRTGSICFTMLCLQMFVNTA